MSVFMKPVGTKTKNVRCPKCNKWVRIPGWARTHIGGKRYKDAVVRCPHCKGYFDITIEV